ncbi:RPS1 [Symbiodinium sp. CCMP2592]|nr:RPS1 [Symbiodinium sp. CCMP2592]
MCGSLPLVGLAAAVGCIMAARSTVQRRYTGSYNMDPRIGAGEPTTMTEDEKAEWLEKKTAELEELMPMTDIEFEDMVSEQTWQWARHLLPFQNRRRHEIAEFKRRCILKQPELFKKLRLWHPLALKYPTVIRRFDNLGPSDIENRDLMIDVEMLANTEKIAGFTYRDFLEETAGNKFSKEAWVAPEVGDTVTGTIMYLGEDGAFVELDCGGVKSWAQLPTRLASLKPIASVSEVDLEVGAKIEAVVVEKDLTSLVLGDPTAVQYIVSLSNIELDAVWNKVERTMAGEEGYDPLWQVQVLQMANWGAQVMTEEGLIGMIPVRDLGDKAGDPGMVGANLTVSILSVTPENRENTNPQMVSDYAITFSYASVMKKVLAEKINEGDAALGASVLLFGSLATATDPAAVIVDRVDLQFGEFHAAA